jgi:hypothetical protein
MNDNAEQDGQEGSYTVCDVTTSDVLIADESPLPEDPCVFAAAALG